MKDIEEKKSEKLKLSSLTTETLPYSGCEIEADWVPKGDRRE